MNKGIDNLDKIMANRELFYQTVYTPLSEAVQILEERQKDKNLIKKIEELLGGDIPEPLKNLNKYAINTKQIPTPNYDIIWFIKLANEFKLKILFSEYLDDKFTSNNAFKHSLGVLHFKDDFSGKEDSNLEKVKIVDFKKYDGKKIKEVLTLDGKNLVDYHKRLLKLASPDQEDFIFYDTSEWLKRAGGKAENFYKKEILLYICHGILFENFLLNGKDGKFTKNIVLPAFQEVYNLTGLKPLIVPIPPMDFEDEEYWISYPSKIKSLI